MATAPMQREQQLDLYPRPAQPFVPHFEQVEGRWTWKHVVALTGFSILVHVAFLLCVVAVIVALPKNSPIVLSARELIGKDESVKYMQLAPDQQAGQAASVQRNSGGISGEYGSGPAIANGTHRAALEILSDTLGVDFAPYLRRMRLQVSTNWENVMPESVFPPLRKQGVVVVEFSVLENGTVTGIRLVSRSGGVALGRAA